MVPLFVPLFPDDVFSSCSESEFAYRAQESVFSFLCYRNSVCKSATLLEYVGEGL